MREGTETDGCDGWMNGVGVELAQGFFEATGTDELGSCLIAGFRPAGRVPFGSCPKRNQKVLPLHPALRFATGSFSPPPLRGSPYKGHPWPFTALAASMPLAPLHDGSVHPPEGAIGSRLGGSANRTMSCPRLARLRGTLMVSTFQRRGSALALCVTYAKLFYDVSS